MAVLSIASQQLVAQNPGERDSSFLIGTAADNAVTVIEQLPGGMIILGGSFTHFNNAPVQRLIGLATDGSLHPGFVPNTLPGGGANGPVRSSTVQPDGKLLIGGLFDTVNGQALKNIARLHSNGVVDTGFDVGIGASNEVLSIATNGNRIVLTGFFNTYNGHPAPGIICLLPNGTIDTTFSLPAQFSSISATHVMPNNQVYIAGNFTSYNSTPAPRIARLNADGSLDVTFNPGSGASGSINDMAVQADGKLVIVGTFSTVNGFSRNRIARLITDGSLDVSFNPGAGASSGIRTVSILSDSTIFIGGDFVSYDGFGVNRIAKVLPDGSRDTTFYTGSGSNGSIMCSRQQADGKILHGGVFTQYHGVSTRRVIRLLNEPCLAATQPTLSTNNPTLNCAVDSATLTLTGTLNNSQAWTWYKGACGGPALGTGNSITVSPRETTTYYVRGSGTCTGPCGMVTVNVVDTVAPVPVLPSLPDFSAHCQGVLSTTPMANDLCTGTILGTTSDPRVYGIPGNYVVTWHYDDGNGNIATQIQNVIISGIAVSVLVDTVTPQYQYDLTSDYTSATAQYMWVNCDSNFAPVAIGSPVYVPLVSGSYAVIVSDSGCVDTSACIQVNLSTVSVGDISERLGIRAFPNPGSDYIMFASDAGFRDATLSLRNMQGQVVLEQKLSNVQVQKIPISILQAGVYVAEVLQDGRAVQLIVVKM